MRDELDAEAVRDTVDAEAVRYTLDAAAIRDREGLHDALAAALALPGWYGRNLDALYDCLTEFRAGEISVLHPASFAENLGGYGSALLDTLRDAARDNPNLRLILEDSPECADKGIAGSGR